MFKKIFIMLIISTMLVFGTQSFADNSKTINFISHYKPGGSHGRALLAFKDYLTKKGYNVNINHIKGCSAALDLLRSGKGNDLLITISTEYKPGNPDAWCKYTAEGDDDFKINNNLWRVPIYLTNIPGNNLSIDDLYKTPIKLGVTADYVPIANAFLKNIKDADKLQVKVVPYRGGGALRQAIAAKDVDIVFMSGVPPETKNFLGATDFPNARNVEFYGKFINPEKKEQLRYQVLHYFLVRKSGIDPKITDAINDMLMSDDFVKWRKTNGYNSIQTDIEILPILKKYSSLAHEYNK